MIRYFRINDPYRLVSLLILLLILYLPLFLSEQTLTLPELRTLLVGEKQNEGYAMYSDVVDSTPPLAAWFHEQFDSLFGRSALPRHVFAFILIFLQASFLGILFINKKVFSENTYIPALLFGLLFFFSYDTLSLSNELLGSTFIMFALNNLYQELEFRVQRDETTFNLGLFISIATLFAFSFIVFLVAAILILFLFARSSPRKYVLLIFGFLLPHLFVMSISYLNDSLGKLWEYYYVANLGFDQTKYIDKGSLWMLSALPLLYFLISIFMLNREARFSKYQLQILQASFIWIAFSFLFVFYSKELKPQTLIIFIPSFTLLLTHFFLMIRRKKFAEINFWILFTGIVTIAYMARFDKIKSIDYKSLQVTSNSTFAGKKILALEENLSIYYNNELATPYLNWRLAEDVFRNPGYYENVTEVYHAFNQAPPEVVIDRENLLKPFFDRMPEIKKRYERRDAYYLLKKTNN